MKLLVTLAEGAAPRVEAIMEECKMIASLSGLPVEAVVDSAVKEAIDQAFEAAAARHCIPADELRARIKRGEPGYSIRDVFPGAGSLVKNVEVVP